MKYHCLFEQSGTFKKAFNDLGLDAFDYDIKNDFGLTDNVIDLFDCINNYPENDFFNFFNEDDFIIAFYPCTYFSEQQLLNFKCVNYGMKNFTEKQKLKYNENMFDNLSYFYHTFLKFVNIVVDNKIKCIIENPFSDKHFLHNYFCFAPGVIDKDRRQNGDFYKKPTQYFFINCTPKNNFLFEPLDYVEQLSIENVSKNRTVVRSLISPNYAARFIKQYII